MKIRPIKTNADVVTVAGLAEQMHAESTFASLDFDRMVLAETVLRLMDSERGLALVAESDGQIVGGLLATVTQSFHGNDLVAGELGLYVDPGHRGCRAAVSLVQQYIAWAKALGAKRINAGNSAGMDDERYVRFMQRLGFTRAGSFMYLEV